MRHKQNGGTVGGTVPVDDEISGSGDHSGSGDTESSTEVEHIPETSSPSDDIFFSSTMSSVATEQVGAVVPEGTANSTINSSSEPSSANLLQPPLVALFLGALIFLALRPSWSVYPCCAVIFFPCPELLSRYLSFSCTKCKCLFSLWFCIFNHLNRCSVRPAHFSFSLPWSVYMFVGNVFSQSLFSVACQLFLFNKWKIFNNKDIY